MAKIFHLPAFRRLELANIAVALCAGLIFSSPARTQVVGVQGMGFDRTKPAVGSVWKYNGRNWEPVPDLMYEGWENVKFSFANASVISIQAGTPNVIAACYTAAGEQILPQSLRVYTTGEVAVNFADSTTGWCVINRSRQTILAGKYDNLSQSFSAATQVTINHGSTGPVMTACYDQDGYQVYPDSIVNGSGSTTVSFASAQSGRCVVNRLLIDSANTRANINFAIQAQQANTLTHNSSVNSILVQCFDNAGAWFLPQTIRLANIHSADVVTDGSLAGNCLINRSSWGGPQIVSTSGLVTGTGNTDDPVRIQEGTDLAYVVQLAAQIPPATIYAFSCHEETLPATAVQAGEPLQIGWPSLPAGLAPAARPDAGSIIIRLCNMTESDIQLPSSQTVNFRLTRIVQ